MLYFILFLAFLVFRYFRLDLLPAIRGACLVGMGGFALFVSQPVYRMEVLHELPGEAIARSKILPMGLQFFPYLNLTNLIFRNPASGSFCGPCVHYSCYQQKLMDLYGVESTAIAGYSHCALRYVEKGSVYMTDNGFWYKNPVLIGSGNWSPEGPDMMFELPGQLNPWSPYLFPIGMLVIIFVSYLLEATIFSNRTAPTPFRSKGRIRIMPDMTECHYRKAGREVVIEGVAGKVMLNISEVHALSDAPDIFYHPGIGHFKFA